MDMTKNGKFLGPGPYFQGHIGKETSKFMPKTFKCTFFRVVQRTIPKIVNEYDQEIPQSQTADNPVAP